MANDDEVLILTGAHVIDPAQGIDRVADVVVAGGKIRGIGAEHAVAGARTLDLSGHYLTPGWIDCHVHCYGSLGFADPDSIGIYQGVTTYVDAGDAGLDTLDEFSALLGKGKTVTSLYAGPYLRPMGLVGLNFTEGEVRTLGDISIAKWLDYAKENRDFLRYLKIGAQGNYGVGPLKMAKGMADILGLPMYVHIGEFQQVRPDRVLAFDAFRIAEAGDMITHLYHNNLGRVLDADGKVLPVVRDAERRGVLFDIGFGGYNFSWDVAEKAFAQDLVPHLLSSDLQQHNVISPAVSLANVMSIFLRLGMKLGDIVERVTSAPARALSLEDRGGSLRPGLPADITVFRLKSGQFEFVDAAKHKRKAETKIVPVMAFKDGRRYDSDLARCMDERNWFLQIADTKLPAAAARLSPLQRDFLGTLAASLEDVDWELISAETLDLDKATELQEVFHRARRKHALPLADALNAVYDSVLDTRFPMQIGLLLIRLERPFALDRLREVSSRQTVAA